MEDVPPFANTAMDGYAVRAAATSGASEASPVRLRVVGELAAGHAPAVPVGDGGRSAS
jgi:molybdopterin biosynthesis enzyme